MKNDRKNLIATLKYRQMRVAHVKPFIAFGSAVAVPKYMPFNLLNGNNGATRNNNNKKKD